MSIEALLHKEIEAEFDVLKDIDMDAQHYEQSVNGVTKLMDRAIEFEKINIEKQKMEDEKKGKKLDRALTAGTTLLSIGTMVAMTVYTFANEKDVPVTTILGRSIIQKFPNLFKLK